MPNTREKLFEMNKVLCNSLHCNYDEMQDAMCIDTLLTAENLIANGVTVQKWIPVTERLPEEDVRALVWVGENSCYFPVIDTDRIHNGRWVRWDEYITYWMPLPEPPHEG